MQIEEEPWYEESSGECNILGTITCCDCRHLVLKMIMYTCEEKAWRQGVVGQGALYNLGLPGRGLGYMWQFNADIGLARQTFVSVQAIIPQESLYTLLISSVISI
jgi:hypothetical protein